MRKLSVQTPIIREAEERILSELQKDWREYFGAKLAKFGASSPAELSEEKKKEFFNELKSDWERGKGVTAAGKKDIEEQGVKEGEEVNEARVVLDTTEPESESLQKFIKKNNIKMKDVTGKGPSGGNFAEYEYTGSAAALKKMVIDFWDDEDLVDLIESIEVNEARSLDKVQSEWSKVSKEMADLAKKWKTVDGEEKTQVLDSLKKLTANKKNLEKEINDIISNKDKDIELVVMEAEAAMNEAEIKTEDEFKEYAENLLKKAHGDDYDEAKAKETIDGILKKADGDFGAAVGMITSGLSEEKEAEKK